VRDVVTGAFGRDEESMLVERLHADGAAVIALVAVADDHLVGHVLFSRMTAPFPALGLAPLSVAPAHQGRGIGRALVNAGLSQAAVGPWRGVFVLGDPVYYKAFGFRPELARGFASPYAGPHFMALELGKTLPAASGPVEYAPAFADLD